MIDIPTLTTDRLVMRAPELSDFDAYAAFRASDQMTHVGGPVDRGAAWGHFTGVAGQWAIRGYGRWMVTDRADGTFLGLVGIYHPDDWPEAEIGWSVTAAAQGRGIAQEAAKATRTYAYDTLGWSTIISLISEANTRSQALARRMGCTPDGTFDHGTFGAMTIWRHPAPEDAR